MWIGVRRLFINDDYLVALTNENLMITRDYLHTDNWVVLPSEELKHYDDVDYHLKT